MSDRKHDVMDLLKELAHLTSLDEQSPQSFRARAYDNARHGIEAMTGDIEQLSEKELVGISGVGKATAKKIREYFETGKITKLEKLREKFPPPVVALSRIPGLGPKTLARLRERLDVQSVEDLKRAIAEEKLRDLPGMGAKTEQKLAKAIERLGLTGKEDRRPIAVAMPVARRVVRELEAVPGVKAARYCGSLRRMRETIGDIDVVVAADDAAPVMERVIGLPIVDRVIVSGDTKTSVLTRQGLQVDVRVVKPAEIGAASLYFTGSKAHNIRLRQRALSKGWTLNEYGLTDVESGAMIAQRTEEDIYRALGLTWIPEPMREDLGEVEAAAEDRLPAFVRQSDLNGDLHVHTSLSGDGRSPLEEVLAAARARDYTYLAITDHGEDLAINGVSREALLEQRRRLEHLQEGLPAMRLLHGVELNIGPEGGLDYDPTFRGSFDWCVAAVHSHFDLDRDAQTRRLLRAMDDPAVNVIGHLTGRMIGRRPGIEIDAEAVLKKAAATGTAIELNSALPRLDASTDVLRLAGELGVILVISTDAHHVDELERTRWGAGWAQRGWVDRSQVANTWPLERFLAWAAERRTG